MNSQGAQANGTPVPTNLLVLTRRITVDADGSPRAYHPHDPEGLGTCKSVRQPDGRILLQGICALDQIPNAGILVFRGTSRLRGSALVREWKKLWPLIRDKKIRSVLLEDIVGPTAPEGFYLFYSDKDKLTALFRRQITPMTRDGYPCVQGREDPHPGYFVTATTLYQDDPNRQDRCNQSGYVDSERIPYFVLPTGEVGGAGLGDIVVARATIGGAQRLIYGIVADAGPANKFGEGSIAFNQALMGRSRRLVMNVHGTNSLDISGVTVSVLILGGTRRFLRGDYSHDNIKAVGPEVFARWKQNSRDPMRRLDACIEQAKIN